MIRSFASGLILALSLGTYAAAAEPVVAGVPAVSPEPAMIAPPIVDVPLIDVPVAGTLADEMKALNDEDIFRHGSYSNYFDGLSISELKFSENGFDWQLIRFANAAKPVGPLWMVPHDDENAAFDAMIDALKLYGGVGIAVNSKGWGRMQPGNGTCGTSKRVVTSCDPNRNFDENSALYTLSFLNQRVPGQPIIAFHTNRPGYGNGAGHISMLAVSKQDSFYGNGSVPALDNPDTFGLMSYKIGAPTPEALTSCRVALNASGVNFWRERVGVSDGSMSNYLILNHPEITYFNAESRQEADLAVAAARHGMMAAAFLKDCQAKAEAAAPPPVTPTLP